MFLSEVNGKLLGTATSQFVRYSFDLDGLLQEAGRKETVPLEWCFVKVVVPSIFGTLTFPTRNTKRRRNGGNVGTDSSELGLALLRVTWRTAWK